MKPLIGLPGRRKTGAQVDGFPPALHQLEMDVYLADYTKGVLNAGGLPVNLPIDGDPAEYLERLDGVLLSGGSDLHPSHYGQDEDGNGAYEPERDAFEMELLSGAVEAAIPTLGICRGLQLLNVHCGGTLHQHVPPHSRYDVPPNEAVHEITIEPDSELGKIYSSQAEVNSLHHQTVDRLGEGLTVTASGVKAGSVEGIELVGQPVIAVQWHPEMMDTADPIFGWLVDQAKAYARTR